MIICNAFLCFNALVDSYYFQIKNNENLMSLERRFSSTKSTFCETKGTDKREQYKAKKHFSKTLHQRRKA